MIFPWGENNRGILLPDGPQYPPAFRLLVCYRLKIRLTPFTAVKLPSESRCYGNMLLIHCIYRNKAGKSGEVHIKSKIWKCPEMAFKRRFFL